MGFWIRPPTSKPNLAAGRPPGGPVAREAQEPPPRGPAREAKRRVRHVHHTGRDLLVNRSCSCRCHHATDNLPVTPLHRGPKPS